MATERKPGWYVIETPYGDLDMVLVEKEERVWVIGRDENGPWPDKWKVLAGPFQPEDVVSSLEARSSGTDQTGPKHMVVVGNPLDGPTYYGPFNSLGEADEWTEPERNEVTDLAGQWWKVVKLEDPYPNRTKSSGTDQTDQTDHTKRIKELEIQVKDSREWAKLYETKWNQVSAANADLTNRLTSCEAKLDQASTSHAAVCQQLDQMRDQCGDLGMERDNLRLELDEAHRLLGKALTQTVNLMEQNGRFGGNGRGCQCGASCGSGGHDVTGRNTA